MLARNLGIELEEREHQVDLDLSRGEFRESLTKTIEYCWFLLLEQSVQPLNAGNVFRQFCHERLDLRRIDVPKVLINFWFSRKNLIRKTFNPGVGVPGQAGYQVQLLGNQIDDLGRLAR